MNGKYCLYFLLQGRRIVYVGVSRVLLKRLSTNAGEKRFNYVKYFEMPDRETALRYEKRWIIKFDPEYNTAHARTRGIRFIPYGRIHRSKWQFI